MRLEAGYTPSEYSARAKSLREAAVALNDSIGQVAPRADILLLGSLGRRLAMWSLLKPGDTSLGEYLEEAPEVLRPRRGERNVWDIDIGVPESAIKWPQITAIAGKVTKNYPQIEVDPHLLSMRGINEFKVNNHAAINRGDYMRFQIQQIGVEESELSWKIMDIDTMLAYYFEFGRLRPKDVKEIAFVANFLTREVSYEQEIFSERIKTGLRRYLGSGQPIKDIIRECYHVLVPRFIQREVSKIRHGKIIPELNFNSPDELYF